MISLEEIGEKADISRSTFKFLYQFFSSHVHGLPMSFYRMGRENGSDRGRGLPSEVEDGYSCLCLSFAVSLLVKARDEIKTLFNNLEDVPRRAPVSVTEEQLDSQVHGLRHEKAFAVGDTVSLALTDELRAEVKHTAEGIIDITYICVKNDDPVLKRVLSEDGSQLPWFDEVFWSVYVNGKAASARDLTDFESKRKAFKIDASTRSLHFKF